MREEKVEKEEQVRDEGGQTLKVTRCHVTVHTCACTMDVCVRRPP